MSTVNKQGNPWFNIKCEGCKRQILSYNNLGSASWFSKKDNDPWMNDFPDEMKRNICVSCSRDEGYNEE